MMRMGLATPKAVLNQETAAYAAMAYLELENSRQALCGTPPPLPALLPDAPALPCLSPALLGRGISEEGGSTTCAGSDEHDPATTSGSEELDVGSPPPGLTLVKVDQNPLATNRGSLQHHAGACRPCAWFWKPTGCENGVDCDYCHICPEGELKVRKKSKQAMLRMGLISPNAAASADNEGKYSLSLSACV